MKKRLETLTLGDSNGNMGNVYCKGHVTPADFNRAFMREWKADNPKYKQSDLAYFYGAIILPKKENGIVKIRKTNPKTKGARKYTVANWDK